MGIRRARRRVSGSAGVMRRRSFVRRIADLAAARPRSLLAAARHLVARRRSARVPRGPVTTIEERYRAEEGAPHVLSEHAASLGGIAESSRSHDFGVPATSTCDCSGVVSAHETPGPNAGSPMPRWGHEPARGRGGIPAAKHASVPQLDVAGTPGEGLPRRFRDTSYRSGVRRQNVRGTLFRSAPFLDRG